MKMAYNVLALACCILFLTACPAPKKVDGMRKLKENHYDFSSIERKHYRDLFFYVPSYLERDYNTSYLYKKDGDSYSNPEAGLFLSVEEFTENEAEDFQFSFDDNTSKLEAVHYFYAEQRINSLYKPKVSIISDGPKKALKSIYQFVEGSDYEYGEPHVYFLATIEKKKGGVSRYYVLQFVTHEDLAKYLTDDYRQTLKRLK